MSKIILTETQLKRLMENIVTEKADGDVKLRKLTFKSKWDFNSKHQGLKIEDVWKEKPSSILWAYLNLEKISFVDEVLEKLEEKYPTFNRIEKPGVDKEQYDEIMESRNPFKDKTYQELLAIVRAKRINGEPIGKILLNTFYKKRTEHKMEKNRLANPHLYVDSKMKLARKNQGHSMSDGPPKPVKGADPKDEVFPATFDLDID